MGPSSLRKSLKCFVQLRSTQRSSVDAERGTSAEVVRSASSVARRWKMSMFTLLIRCEKFW